MKNQKKMLLFLLSFFLFLEGSSAQVPGEEIKEKEVSFKGDLAFLESQLKEKQDKEKDELKYKLEKEREEIFSRLEKEQRELEYRLRNEQSELLEATRKIEREKKEFNDKYEKLKSDLERKHREELRKDKYEKKAYKEYRHNAEEGFDLNTDKNKLSAEEKLRKRIQEIKSARDMERFVDIERNDDDPLYITQAEVKSKGTKTEFLKITDLDLKYRIKVFNQTPKIITYASFVWERTEPFTDRNSTILRETKLDKPITPYEERKVEYNDLDTLRNGEIYKVKVANVVFEDGSRWINPSILKKTTSISTVE